MHAPLTSSPIRADRLWAQEREYIVPRIRIDANNDLYNFSRCGPRTVQRARLSARLPQRLHKFRWVDRDAVLHGDKQHRLGHVVEHGEMARRAPPNNNFILPPRPRCMFSSRGMLNPRTEDVDFYICEYFGQMLVTVGEFTPSFEKQPASRAAT